MQILTNTVRSFLSRSSPSSVIIQKAGLKIFPPPVEIKNAEYPERNRLRLMERVPQYPPSLRPFRMQKRLKLMRGPEEIHNTLIHKQYGIVATGGGRMRHGHFEMIRMTLVRKLDYDNLFAVWRVDPPWQPITKKAQGTRMGGGKGSIDHYATPIKAGRIIIEVAGNAEFFKVEKVLKQIARLLPFQARPINQEMLEKEAEEERRLEENNLHTWTWKYIIQNNMAGCHNWISPYDKKWYNKYK